MVQTYEPGKNGAPAILVKEEVTIGGRLLSDLELKKLSADVARQEVKDAKARAAKAKVEAKNAEKADRAAKSADARVK
jgi:hypothetical protein